LYSLSREEDCIVRYDKDGTNGMTVCRAAGSIERNGRRRARAHRLAWARVASCHVTSIGVCKGAIYEADESGVAVTQRLALENPPIAFAADDDVSIG
jgi:hypothetical protein